MSKQQVIKTAEVVIEKVVRGQLTFCVLGVTPLICNRMSQKVMETLLFPSRAGKMTTAEKATNLKHDPISEFRESPYKNLSPDGPTRLQLLSSMFKKAMMSAAIDLPGARRTQIGKLVHVESDRIDLYGVPEIFMAVTRSADINKTPDVRTRAILREWACIVTVSFQKPIIGEQSIINLLSAAGRQSGVGDWRAEKGAGVYGSFDLVSNEDPNLMRILKLGREHQDSALANPSCYDDETETMLSWYLGEATKRGVTVSRPEAAAAVGGTR